MAAYQPSAMQPEDSPHNIASAGGHSAVADVGLDSSTSGYSINSHCQLIRDNPDPCESGNIQLHSGNGPTLVTSEYSEEDNLCGMGKCHPKKLQICANIKVFVLALCLLLMASGALSVGYFNSVITTIEKRFEIGSSISGLIAASYEFGSLASVIFVSYLGGRRNIPKWIAIGVVFMGIGGLLFAVPHIIAPKYSIQRGIISGNGTDQSICRTSQIDDPAMGCIKDTAGNWGYVLVLMIAQIMIGTGGTPILTLGTTYVDNHVSKEKAPAYLAFVYATGALGPILGYSLGALLLQFYVDSFSYEVELLPNHPRWVGAWWGGFIICGAVLLVLSLPFFAFPKVLVHAKRQLIERKAKEELLSPAANDEETEDYGRRIRDIPRSVARLLKNWIYLITCLGICCEVSIVSGFVLFLPKYLETQFGLTTSVANLFTGGIAIPGAVVGILVGGYIVKRFQLGPKGAVQLTLLIDILALIGFVLFFFLGCQNGNIAGATRPYFNSTGHQIFEANLTSTCNQNCDCDPNNLAPICGINDVTYFSPCHAGCTQYYGSSVQFLNYSSCSCIATAASEPAPSEVIKKPLATDGPCKNTCNRLLPFLIFLVIMTFFVAGTQMPLLMVTLRSVRQEERAFALGMQFVLLRVFSYIPSPIMFGNIIDSTCLLWKKKCQRNGWCLLYDIENFRFKYVGISAGLKLLGVCLFFIVWVIMKRQNRPEHQIGLTVGEMVNSVGSIDKLDFASKANRTSIETSHHASATDLMTDPLQETTRTSPRRAIAALSQDESSF